MGLLDSDVSCKATKQWRGYVNECGSLILGRVIFYSFEPLAERGEGRVPRWKLRDVAKSLPSLKAHLAIVTAAAGGGEQVRSRPLWNIGQQPFGERFDVGCSDIERIVRNIEQHEQWPDPVHDEAEGAGPSVTDIGKCLGIDISTLKRCLDLVEGRVFLAGERIQHE